ncbi:MAG: hypothetical protein HQ494_00125, partial [Rhodospirillales bacterium]|nr:hypothetical protein [Rhodospirillales bacterium]
MTIRNITTTAAIAIVLGLSVGSAFASNSESHAPEGFLAAAGANYPGMAQTYNADADAPVGFMVDAGANYPGMAYVYKGDADI